MRIKRVVDLSVPVGPRTVVYPGDPAPSFTVHSTITKDGFNLLDVHMGSQSGTHVDAPYHFEENTPRIDEVPLDRFVGPGVIIDATSLGARMPITWDLIEPVSDKLGPGVIVLLHTGWSRHYGTPEYFDHPYLDSEACRRMLEAGVRTFCLDAINIDETPNDAHAGVGFPCHHLISTAHGVIGENFCNFDLIDFADPLVVCTPIKLEGADGAPVRAAALQLGS